MGKDRYGNGIAVCDSGSWRKAFVILRVAAAVSLRTRGCCLHRGFSTASSVVMSARVIIGCCCPDCALAILRPPIEIHLLQDGAEVFASGRIAKLLLSTAAEAVGLHIALKVAVSSRILDMEHWFPRINEGLELVAFVVLRALLVYREVD